MAPNRTRRHKTCIIALLILLLLQAGLSKAGICADKKQDLPTPPNVEDRVRTTPDLMQTLPELGLPQHGEAHCAPVAVSNSLVWLATHGYPKLVPEIKNYSAPATSVKRQGAVIRKLSGTRYMGSDMCVGTQPEQIIRGLDNYINECGYQYESLLYQGWESCPYDHFAGAEIPDINWIKNALNSKSAVWLEIGWRTKSFGYYETVGQHWVTLVGYGRDRKGNANPNIFIIHDPAARSGSTAHDDYVILQPMSAKDRVVGPTKGTGAGLYKMTGELKIKKGAEIGILEGAVILKMR